MKRPNAVNALAAGAAAVTVLLTAAAFWLSYEHLHDIAGANGLDGARAWAWPGTVDMFIIAGELLILRAALRGRFDWFAYLLAGTGSLGSIALNVAGVGEGAELMEYIVAAVPPVAALLAFAALMRQVHEALSRFAAPAPEPVAVLLQRDTHRPVIKVPAAVPPHIADKPFKALLPAPPEPAAEPAPELTAIGFLARRHKVRPEQVRTVADALAEQPGLSGKAAGAALGTTDRYGRRVLAAAKELTGATP